METKINAVYVRVSTEKQSCEMQIHSITDFLKTKGITTFEIYRDEGESGSKESRPQLNRLLNDIKQGKVDTLCVYRLDRLFRSLSHLIASFKLFRQFGVKFMSVSDHVDMTTAQGVLMMHLMGAFAEFERNLISQRTKDGLATAVGKGLKLGAPTTVSSQIRDLALLLRQEHKSYGEIADKLNISRSTVHRIVKGKT